MAAMGRPFLALLLLLTPAVAPPAPAAAQDIGLAELSPAPLSFRVTRDGAPLGTHRVSFTRDGDRLVVDIAIRFAVRLAFIPVFRYTHDARETWQNGRLIAFDSRTDDDGTTFEVRARAAPEGLRVSGSGGDYLAPSGTVPSSYWHPGMIDHPRVLDSQSGRMIDLVATPSGVRDEAVGGRTVPLRLYRLSGEIAGELGYGPADDWALLRFQARGSEIKYARD